MSSVTGLSGELPEGAGRPVRRISRGRGPIPLVVRRGLSLVSGWVAASLGIVLLVRSGFGVETLSAVGIGLASRLGVSTGFGLFAASLLLVGAALVLGARVRWGTVAGFIVVAGLVDGFGRLFDLVERGSWQGALTLAGLPSLSGGLLAAVGALLLVGGVCLVVLADVGTGPPEMVMLALVGRGVTVLVARSCFEAVCLVLAWVLSGPVGPLTVVWAVCSPAVFAWLLPRFAVLVGLPDPTAPEATVRLSEPTVGRTDGS